MEDDQVTLATTEQLKQLSRSRAQQMVAHLSALTSEESVARMEAWTITSDAEEKYAVELLQQIKAEWHNVEEQRTSITGPMNRALRATNDFFRPTTKALEKEETILKLKLAEYMERKQATNVAQLQAASEAETPAQAQRILAHVAPVAPPQGVSMRKVWKFVVEDESLVPREYCSPDPKKIAGVDPTTTAIPGVRFYEDASVTVRRQ